MTPVVGRSPGEGKGDPLQYSDLENSMESMGSQRVRPDRTTFTFMQNLGKPTKNNVASHTRNSRTCREAPETREDAMWGAA